MQFQYVNLTIWDLVLTPIYLFFIIFIARKHRDQKYPPGNLLRQYYLPGLYVKLGGAIFIGLIYHFYYGGGDTFNYFNEARLINSSLNDSFDSWMKLIGNASYDRNPELFPYISQMFTYNDLPSHTVAVITAILGLLNGTTYIPVALLFAFISYTGVWTMYRTFVNIYPKLHRPLAIAFLFIPTVIVWGSSIFKDTVCIFALGWMTYTTFRIFVNKDLSFKNFSLLVISFLLLALIKIYILLAFVPALAFWLLSTYSHRIRIASVRFIVQFIVLGIVVLSFQFFSQRFSKELNQYSLENILKTAQNTREWISYVSQKEEGSKYDLGEFDPSIGGMISKFPAAVNVTLYRPYLWEVRNPLMLLSALESFAFLLLTLIIFFKVGFFKTFQKIFKDPNLLFFFSFTLIFAFAIGISTGNFGTLSRYKIPCMPFFAALLLILYYQNSLSIQKKASHAKPKAKVYHFS
jgi:hypothetical protein